MSTGRQGGAGAGRNGDVRRRLAQVAVGAGSATALMVGAATPASAVAADSASCMGQAASEGATGMGGLGEVASSIAGPGVGVNVISPNARTRGGSHCLF